MKLQPGIYGFEVWKEKPEDGDWLLARLYDERGKEISCTQGRTESEILDMIADALKRALDIPVPWYDKLYASFKRLLKLS